MRTVPDDADRRRFIDNGVQRTRSRIDGRSETVKAFALRQCY